MKTDPNLFRYLENYSKLQMHLVPVAGPDWQGDWDLGKQPLISIYEASRDMSVIEAWAKKWPGCNWGWVPQQGRANLDVDPRHGGDVALAKLEAKHGPLPIGPRVRTGGGGWHDTLAVPPGMAFDVDIEGNEGLTFSSGKRQFLLPPSIHRNGTPYVCERKFTTTPANPASDWLMAFVTHKPTARIDSGKSSRPAVDFRPTRFKAAASSLADDPGAAEGSRRKTLVRLLGIELAKGRTAEEIEPEAVAWADRCTPPLAESEVLRCLDSLARRHDARSVVAVSGTAHPTPQDGERPGPGKEGRNSSDAQTDDADRPDLIPSFPAEVAEPSPDPAPNAISKAALLKAQARTLAWAQEFIPSFRRPDADAFTLAPEARVGFMKAFTAAVEPQLEGDIGPAALCLMTAVGSAAEHGPHVEVGAGRHHGNTNVCVTAPSGVGKSEPWDIVSRLMEKADPQWLANSVCYGLGSGEGLVERLRDGWTEAKPDKVGQMQFVQHPGATTKTLLVIESELGRVVNLGRRDGSTLGQNLCFGWDGKTMEVANRGQNKLKASGHHLSVWGNITTAEIRRKLRNSLEEENGFVNRFLWPLQTLRRSLPFGGDLSGLLALAPALASVITKAKSIGKVRWAACGAKLWAAAYPKLQAVQTHMPVLGRARSQALRLSLLFALLDGSDEIRAAHVTAALSVWAYAEASARLIFGDEPSGGNAGDSPAVAGVVLQAITRSPGVSRTGLYDALGHGMKSEALSEALLWLESHGHAYRRTVKTGTGRPAECWWPTPSREPEAGPQPHTPDPGGGEAGSGELRATGPMPGPTSFRSEPEAVAGPTWKEGTISKPGVDAQAVELRKEGIKSEPVPVAQASAEARKEGINSEPLQRPLANAEDISFLPSPAVALHGGGSVCAVPPEVDAPDEWIWFGVNEPFPEGWLDAKADAALIEKVWPVPKGWHRRSHGRKFGGVDEQGATINRSIFNTKWPVRATAPIEWDDDDPGKIFDDDPAKRMVVLPQPI